MVRAWFCDFVTMIKLRICAASIQKGGSNWQANTCETLKIKMTFSRWPKLSKLQTIIATIGFSYILTNGKKPGILKMVPHDVSSQIETLRNFENPHDVSSQIETLRNFESPKTMFKLTSRSVRNFKNHDDVFLQAGSWTASMLYTNECKSQLEICFPPLVRTRFCDFATMTSIGFWKL